MRKPVIGVMGGSEGASTTAIEWGYQLGQMIAQRNWVLLSGDWTENLPETFDDVRNLGGVLRSSNSGGATTLAVVATNAALDRPQLSRIAAAGTQGLARSVHPISSLNDGDTVFALSSLSGEHIEIVGMSASTLTDIVGIGAAEAVRKAVLATLAEP